SLYVLHCGNARIYRLNAQRKEQVVRVLAHAGFISELAHFNQAHQHECYAEVMEDAQVCGIDRKDTYELMQKYTNVSSKFMERCAKRLNESESLTSNISLLSTSERLREYIRTHRKEDKIELEMTKKDLASYLSMQPETLTRNFKKLEEQGVIKKIDNKSYDIIDI